MDSSGVWPFYGNSALDNSQSLSLSLLWNLMSSNFRFKATAKAPTSAEAEAEAAKKQQVVVLGEGSEVIHIPRFLPLNESWNWFDYLDKQIPWTRPTIRVFGRYCLQPRDTCYVATPGLPNLTYSGYQPQVYSWEEFPLLTQLLDAVHKVLPGSTFNSLLLNRYKGGDDYVSWHADDEKIYGLTPEIASLSFGCDREFLLRRKKLKTASHGMTTAEEPMSKRLKKSNSADQHSFNLKHGSLLVMRGYTQRDWLHSVPKRAKAAEARINLTFRRVMQ